MSQTEFDLGEFLNRQAAGGSLDSEGEFTVDHDKAARKLARFAMPHEYSWVLKLVQVAVGWESAEMRVDQQKLFTSFTFTPHPRLQIPTAREVVSTILHGQLESREPLNRLCIALRSLVEQTGLSFVLALSRAENENTETLFAGPDVSSMTPEARRNWGALATRGVRVTVSHQMRGEFYTGRLAPRFMLRKLRDLEIADQLRQNAFVSPIPILLNGRSINDPLSHPEYGFSDELRPLFMLGLRSLGERTLPLAGPFEDGLAIPVRAAPSRILSSERITEPFGGWVIVQVVDPEIYAGREYAGTTPYQDLPSTGLWIQDGVVVESLPLLISKSALTRMVLILDADGLETDLTGFALQKTDEKSDRFAHGLIQAKKRVREALDSQSEILSTDRRHLTKHDKKVSQTRFGRQALKNAAYTLPLFLWNPLIGGGVMASTLFLQGVGHLFPQVEAADESYQKDLTVAIRRLSGSSSGGADF